MKNKFNSNEYTIINSVNNEDLIDLTCDQDLSDLELPKKLKNNIKAKTIKELDLKPRIKPKSVFKVSIASLLAVLVLFVATTPSAMASITKVIRYIPGFNMLLSEESSTLERYVLEKPINANIRDMSVEITGLVADNKSVSFYMNVTGGALSSHDKSTISYIAQKNFVNNLIIKDADGNTLKRGLCSYSGADGIIGQFNYIGDIKCPQSLQIIFENDEKSSLFLNLIKAKDYNSFAELGPTDNKNGIRVTAVFSNKDNVKNITLLSPPLENGYTISSYYIGKIKVTDELNNEYKISYKKGPRIGHLNEFGIYLRDINQKTLNICIPEIEVNYVSFLDGEKIKLDIPESGSMNLNKKVEIHGHPINITKVEKIENNQIRVYVDLSNNERNNEYLKLFLTESGSFKCNEDTGLLEYFEVKYNPDEKTKVLKVNNIYIVKKGPWILKIDK